MHTFRFPFQAMACHCEVVLATDPTDADPARLEVHAHAQGQARGQARGQAERQAQTAIDEVLRIEAKFSRYREDSVIARINAAAGHDPVVCDSETAQLLAYADQLHRISGGLFDITAGVLRRAWNFKEPRLPAPEVLEPLLALIGWDRVQHRGHTVHLPVAGMQLDFGGFGKEYAADRAGAMLQRAGVKHGYVNLGGDMRFIGPKPGGAPWMVGIQHPRVTGEVVATLPMFSGGLATSGDYERYFEIDGQRYCHILDPRTGMPVKHWRSVSAMAPLAVVAGNATTIAMLAQAQGLDFLRSSGLKFLAVDAQGDIHTQVAPELEPAEPPAGA